MTAGQHIDYEALAQEAMRSVVRSVLVTVGETGLVGDHHFYIAFNTQASGVNISKRLKEKYPVEMTIVLQHRFWDLEVNDERFEVKLTFDGIPERLVVPFQAVKVFYDPSVPYGLQFEESELMTDHGRKPQNQGQRSSVDDATADSAGFDSDRRRPSTRRTRPETVEMTGDAKPTLVPVDRGRFEHARAERDRDVDGKPAAAPQPVASKPAVAEAKVTEDAPKPDNGGAKVVDLSKFRKK